MDRKHCATPKPSYALVSLGCPKNLVDSERMAGLLQRAGYQLAAQPEGADFVVINTCGFIADARSESHAVIREMLALKRRGRLGGVIVAGCLAQRDQEKLLEMCPEIDQLVGVFGREEIVTAARRTLEKGTLRGDCPNFRPTKMGLSPSAVADGGRMLIRPVPARALPDTERLRITPPHVAFLKIAEGCSRSCSFCAIPQLRGPYASKPIEEVVAEAEELAADGARELVLIAQDTSSYGLDIYGRPRLAELLRRLEQLEGPAWIRLMYLYPIHVSDELIEVIAGGKKILPYLDLPLQHIDDEILGRMRRRVTGAETESLLDRLRGRIDRLVLRTTFLTGFPGETEEQFERLLEFVRRRRFERLGAFAYSAEPGTMAAGLAGALPEEVRTARRDRLLAAQQPIAFAWSQSLVGKQIEVILDRPLPGEPDVFLGRTYADAPEVDGGVYVSGKHLAPGRILPCEVVAASGYDLVAAARE
ncbi:MAG: 30S ribosomal protein S12 methylthiotransferase RimO [Thermoguttaceae bacterium]